MRFIKTDPNLKPTLRFLNILDHNLHNENYRLVKSNNAFKRDLDFGQQVIRFSFISTMGAIHGIETVHTIKINDFEKVFRKVFKKYSWKEWTCFYHVYGNETWLCNEETFAYSDETLNEGAKEFFNTIKPQIDTKINSNYLDELYLELTDFTKQHLSFIRIERRVLLSIWLAKKRNDSRLAEIKTNSLELFKASNEWYKSDLEEVLSVVRLIELDA